MSDINDLTTDQSQPQGWDIVLEAVALLETAVDTVFEAHDTGLAFGTSEAARLGEDHPPGLVCGCTGAPMYAAALMQLLGRHLEGICRLARLHAGYVYPARTLSRAMLDHSGRILWLLQLHSSDEREVRFLAAKAEESRLIQEAYHDSKQPDWVAIAKETFNADLPRIPPFSEMAALFPMGEFIMRAGYRELSQASHGTLMGSATLNQEVRERWPEEAGNVVELIASAFWTDLLEAAAIATESAVTRFVEAFAPGHKVDLHDLGRSVFDLMARLPTPVAEGADKDSKPRRVVLPNRKARRAAAAKARRRS